MFRSTPGDAGNTARSADKITDFSHADGDTIKLSGIDAVSATPENDAFRFVGNAAFSGSAGELRYEMSHGNTLVMGDTDGDRVADLVINLTGTVALVASVFVLANGNAFDVVGDAAPVRDMDALGGAGIPAMPQANEMVV